MKTPAAGPNATDQAGRLSLTPQCQGRKEAQSEEGRNVKEISMKSPFTANML
jgi:hypothetical protein